MEITPSDFEKIFHDSPLARMVIYQSEGKKFFIATANKAALEYFRMGEKALTTISVAELLDIANTDHVVQALSICFQSKVSISIQVLPKLPGSLQVQSFMLNPIKADDGHVLYVDMQARPPAMDQAAIERERDDAISMFTTVFDVSDVGIIVTDHHGRVVRANKTFLELSGWESVDLVGEDFTVFIPEEEHAIARERHKRALTQEQKTFGELRLLKKDGSIGNILASSVILELSNGRRFSINTIVDITYLKMIEADLRQAIDNADEASRAKSAFLANMSHELRTPLNAIIGFSEMMINATLGPIENEHYVEYLGDIKFSAQHLLQIINDVLDMSKIEAGKMPLMDEDLNIVGLLESVRRLMAARAEQQQVRILPVIAPKDIAKLCADERLVRQIFLNLLSNAVKFSRPEGTISISVTIEDNGDMGITVQDHGIGIPAERMKDVMEPFGQITDPRVNKGQGTGLGLPIARAMIEMHGGTLVVASEVNKGTKVTCIFPVKRVRK